MTRVEQIEKRVFETGVIYFYDEAHTGERCIPVENMHVVIAYAEQTLPVPMMNLLIWRCGYDRDHRLVLGGGIPLQACDVSVGKRYCPVCWKTNHVLCKVLKDGNYYCPACNRPVSYVQTAFMPYFEYYKADDAEDSCVIANSKAYFLSEKLKYAWLEQPAQDVAIPYLNSKKIIDTRVPAFRHPVAFNINEFAFHVDNDCVLLNLGLKPRAGEYIIKGDCHAEYVTERREIGEEAMDKPARGQEPERDCPDDYSEAGKVGNSQAGRPADIWSLR